MTSTKVAITNTVAIGDIPLHKCIAWLNVPRLIETRLLLNANSGGGKSWALRKILEQTYGNLQHMVIDPEGEFHTLREKFDYILVARAGGDVLADVHSAALLARRLLELGVSAIVDIYELKADDRKRFVRLFLESLINAPRELWHPCMVVLDEAHVFCPQTGEAESADAVKDLMTRGRKRGFCGVLATQRLSKLHKDAAAEANNVLIGRAAQDVDMKRAADLLGFSGRDEQARLRTLDAGRFYAFGPAFVDMPTVMEVRIGSVQTTHPRAGQRSAVPAPPRETVRAVLASLADLPKEAADEAKTVAELRAKVRELERAKPPAPDPALSNAQKEEAFQEGWKAGQLELAESMSAIVGEVLATQTHARRPIPVAPLVIDIKKPLPYEFERKMEVVSHLAPVLPHGSGLQRMMVALAQCPRGLSAKQIGVRAGMSSSSGTFSTYLGRIRSNRWVTGDRSRLVITADGISSLGKYEPLPTGPDLLAYWVADLGGGAARMLQCLAAQYPESITAEQLGEAAEISSSSGTFSTYLGRLRALELVTGGRGALRASEDLF